MINHYFEIKNTILVFSHFVTTLSLFSLRYWIFLKFLIGQAMTSWALGFLMITNQENFQKITILLKKYNQDNKTTYYWFVLNFLIDFLARGSWDSELSILF